jgi:transposase InsO family protein
MGIRDRPTAPRSPWQNGYAERLIGSIRRDCLDHVIVFGERILRHVLRSYAQYHNGARTHLSLAKDSPLTRSTTSGSDLRQRQPLSYQQYYNGTRTHLALAKDSPLTRSVQAIGSILPLPILGGLHHRYVRI